MRTRLLKLWDNLQSNFWFVPVMMAVAAILLASSSSAIDKMLPTSAVEAPGGWVYTGGAEGASAVLQTIAGSMITVAGVVFSLTLVALSLASSQFGPRLLRNFMRDRTTQVTLGTFIATFLYCLLILRTIRWDAEATFVPQFSVTLGVGLAIASLWVLIHFIHHVSVSIQADEIVARVGDDIEHGINRLFPQEIGEERPDAVRDDLPALCKEAPVVVPAPDDGYIQIIDAEALMDLAKQEELVLRIERLPGQYVIEGSPLVSAWPAERVEEHLMHRIDSAFVVGTHRSTGQDLEFALYQLVEVALRALSPGINDPFTAVACVDRLASALCRLARRDMPSALRYDADGHLRVIAPIAGFRALLDAAFNQIRHSARTNAAVTQRLLEAIGLVATVALRRADRHALQRHAHYLIRGAQEAPHEADAVEAMEEQYAEISLLLHHG